MGFLEGTCVFQKERRRRSSRLIGFSAAVLKDEPELFGHKFGAKVHLVLIAAPSGFPTKVEEGARVPLGAVTLHMLLKFSVALRHLSRLLQQVTVDCESPFGLPEPKSAVLVPWAELP